MHGAGCRLDHDGHIRLQVVHSEALARRHNHIVGEPAWAGNAECTQIPAEERSAPLAEGAHAASGVAVGGDALTHAKSLYTGAKLVNDTHWLMPWREW